ncbi:ABC transporter permease [Murimonas intestini]|uniref:ABC transporter permease n=1 Tax=Murimonas intestini TaxID=1337051 RepID=UPI002ED23675
MDGNITNIKKVQINQRARHGVGKIIMDLPVLFMLVIVCIIMASLNNNFLSATNMISMFTSYSYFIVGAIGLVFVFCAGNSGIDLGVGQVIALSAVMSGQVMSGLTEAWQGSHEWFIILIGLAVSCLVGCFFGTVNGIAVSRFKIAPFIITLASQLIAKGLCLVITDGYTVSGTPRLLTKMSTLIGVKVGGRIIPAAAIIPVVLLVVMGIILSKTTFGRQLILTGSNPQSAGHAGIPVNKIMFKVYFISGLFSGIGGIFVPMCLGASDPKVGQSLLMPMVGAVTIGGISQLGGYGNMVQAGFGILFIMSLMNGMTFLGFGLPTQQLVYGTVLIFTMTLLGYIEKKRFRI